MDKFKVTAWNIKFANKLVDQRNAASDTTKRHALARLDAIRDEIAEIDPEILFVSEGPKGAERAKVFFDIVAPEHTLITRAPDASSAYGIRGGVQWLWYLVKTELLGPDRPIQASLQHLDRWREVVRRASQGEHDGGKWDIAVPKYDADEGTLRFSVTETARHYRHPQVLQLVVDGEFVEIIGAHLRSKHTRARYDRDAVQQESFFDDHPELVAELVTDRVRLTTECADVRYYIESRFEEDENAALIVVGDLNDGPGKERIERRFMYQDLVTALQGDVFFARRFLYHALFDQPQGERWSVDFEDPLDPNRSQFILLDHIMFSQAMTRSHPGDQFAYQALSGHGKVEHEVHHRVASDRFKYAETSDHRPISMTFVRRKVEHGAAQA